MNIKTITSLILAVVLIPILFFGGIPIIVLAVILSTVGSYELVKMHCDKRGLNKKYKYVIPLFTTIIALSIGLKLLGLDILLEDILFIFISIVICLLIISILNKDIMMTDSFYFISSIIYPGIFIMLLVSSRMINKIGDVENNYIGLLLLGYLAVTSFSTDIFAQVFGLKFGRHRLCPDISPKKSVEGAISGTVFGTVLGSFTLILGSYFIGFSLFGLQLIWDIVLIVIMSFFLSIISQLGDLIASRLKREYGIKDYGNIFPGHGGVMDRFDSLSLVGTTFYIILMLLGVL